MAWLDAPEFFDPDPLNTPVVGIAGDIRNHDSAEHCHRMGQMLFVERGYVQLTIGTPKSLCLLPPTRVAWIPSALPHRACMTQLAGYRSVWFNPVAFPALPAQTCIMAASPLLAVLLDSMALAPFDADWIHGKWRHMAALAVSEIAEARREPMTLRLPSDRRLTPLLDRLDELPPTLEALAPRVGASVRTISRIFLRETGLSYQQWRQQWRLIRAVELLAGGTRQTEVASALAFASDSAFIGFFKSMTGQTPRAYLRASSS